MDVSPHFRNAELRASSVRALAAGVATTAGASLLLAAGVGTGPLYPLVATGVFAAATLLVAVAIARGHPFARFGAANYVTMTRTVAAALVAALIGYPGTRELLWSVVVVSAVAAALDGLDGWLARRSRMSSAFGARFDMETDAVLILVLSVLVWQHGKAGWWVLLSGSMRYVFVAASAGLPWLRRPLRATRRGKTIAITQLVVLICAVAPVIPVRLSRPAAAIALAALTWSFAVDVLWLWRHRTPPPRS